MIDKSNASILDRLRYTADMVAFSPAWDERLLADTIREVGQLMERVADLEAIASCTCQHHDDGSCVAAGDLLNPGHIVTFQQANASNLVLTEYEWSDLATIVAHYRNCCTGLACDHQEGTYNDRLRDLIERIVAAVEGPLNGRDLGDNGHAETPEDTDQNGSEGAAQ